MPEMRRQNMRVFGSTSSPSGSKAPYSPRYMTPEQKAQREADNLKSYETWRQAREARIARDTSNPVMMRNTDPL